MQGLPRALRSILRRLPFSAETEPRRAPLIELHQIAAALYLAAGIGSLLGFVLPDARMLRGGAIGLALAAVVHGAAFASLHRLDPPPPLTSATTRRTLNRNGCRD